MNKLYLNSALPCKREAMGFWSTLVFLMISYLSYGQQGSQGNTTVFNGAQATLFGAHTFVTGGTGTQPGIIKTIRTTPFGIVSFGTAATHSGANDASHVDGYVGKYGTTAFTFPIGDATKLRPVSISAPASGDFKAAYWFLNPNDASLPAGAPFLIANLGTGVTSVSNVEYWDVDGPSAVNLTLSWDATSGLSTLTGGVLANLVVVGYNTSTGKWENLGNAGGTTGSLASTGTVTANGVTPDTYSAFTFGTAAAASTPDLRPYIIMTDRNYINGAMLKNLTIRVRNMRENSVATSLITVYVYKPTIQSTFALTGTAAADWTIALSPTNTYYILTSNVDIPFSTAGHNITGTLTMPNSTAKGVYNLRSLIPDLSGGEVIEDNGNNTITTEITRN